MNRFGLSFAQNEHVLKRIEISVRMRRPGPGFFIDDDVIHVKPDLAKEKCLFETCKTFAALLDLISNDPHDDSALFHDPIKLCGNRSENFGIPPHVAVVIPQIVIRRTCHHQIHAFIGELFKKFGVVRMYDMIDVLFYGH